MTTDDEARDYVRRMFHRGGAEPEPEEDTPKGNHVPREGGNPRPPDPDRDMREFARELFNRTP